MITIGKFIDLTGKKYGRLIVIKRVETKNGSPLWECECDCGKHIKTNSRELRHGHTRSCGCLKKETIIQFNRNTKRKYNTYDLSGEYGVGYTSKGEEFYFDLEDYEKIKDHCWLIDNNGYVEYSKRNAGVAKHVLMHRVIMNACDEEDVDHINGASTRNDNRKCNLRVCTHQKNMCNYSKPKNNTSGITGVSWDNTHQVWKAYITYNNQRVALGAFYDFDDAVRTRLLAEKKYFQEYSAQQHLFEQYGIDKE